MSYQTTFASAASTTVTLSTIGSTITLPAVDTNNVDMAIQNLSGTPAKVLFGGGSNLPLLVPDVAGCIVIPGNSTVLLTAQSTIPTLMAAQPAVLSGYMVTPQAQIAATGTSARAVALAGTGTTLVFTRGTASAAIVWGSNS